MSRIKALSRRVAIGLTLAGLLLAMVLHHWPLSVQAAQRLASALMLNPLAKAKPSAEPFAAPFAALTVNSLEDTATPGDGKCTLREALNNANAAGQTTGSDCTAGTGTDTISFSVTGVINLTSALPIINSNVTINGPGPNQLDVHRNTGGNYRIFNILAGKTVSLSGLKVTNGNLPSGTGGGILNAGNLTLTNCVIAGNTVSVTGGFGGGVITISGTLTIINSTISGNSAFQGGGVYNVSGPLTIIGSTISGNTASTNTTGGVYLFDSTATLTNSTISSNTSVGLSNVANTSASSLTVTNCTISGNSSSAFASGIYTQGGGAGMTATTIVKNTLVANNTGGNFQKVGVNAILTSLGNNLDSDGTSGFTNGVNGDIVGTAVNKIDAKLGPLADNGGPTQTHLLLCGSPAIDKGNNTGAPATDQRGVARPVNGTVDIGAVEANPSLTIDPATLPGGFSGKAYNQSLTATGGTAPYTFTATTALPSGLTLSAAGALSGLAPAAGSYTFSVQVTDATGAQGCQTYTLVVGVCPTITVLPATLPDIAVGREFNQTIFQTGSTTTITWTLTGNLPAGLSFVQVNPVAAALAGTPTQQGVFSFTVRATDANGCFGERSYTLAVNCIALAISPPLLPAGVVGVAYNQPLAASCGTAPFSFSVSAGALPAGLTLSTGGVLSGTPTSVGLSIFTIKVTTANNQTVTRAYTLPIYQQQIVSQSDGLANDDLGFAVAISGDTAIVGRLSADIGANVSQGAAEIYVRSGATWIKQAELTANDGATGDFFGWSVAIDGNTAIVGAIGVDIGANAAQGAAYVFVRQGTTWTQQAMLTASDGAANDQFGFSVSVSGDTALVGSPGDAVGANTSQGSAYVFVRSGTTWTQQTKLTASDGALGDQFGFAVAVSGNTAIIGAQSDDVFGTLNQGSVYVFVRNGTTWTPQTQLTASDGALFDNFGISVAISGETVIVGAFASAIGTNPAQGSAYIFVRQGTTWTQQTKLTASDGATNDIFGRAVALNGNTALVGARSDDIGANVDQGSAYVFVRSGTTWTQQAKLIASDGEVNDQFGNSVAVSSTTALIGAPFDNIGANADQGSAHFFNLNLIPCPALTITPASLPGGTTGTAYNQTLTATGGSAPYNFVVTSGTLPTGLTLSTSGLFSGTPTAADTSNFTITATDINGCTGTRSYSLTITAVPTCIPVSISTSLSGATGSTITIPIIVGDLTGKGVSAYDFTLTFDPAVIKPSSTPIDTAGTLSSGFTVTPNTNTPGQITVSAFGSGALTGAGTLLNFKFDLIGTTSACSNLTWTNFVFNEGTPCATTSNGQVCITGGSISGTVNYATAPTTRPVPGVLITAAGTPSATATTSNTGSYSLTGLGGGPYTVTPSKTGQVNGISSFDASLVSQHVAGLNQLTALQQIAADASNNGSVSSFDASLISQTVAGISNSGIGGTWKFVPASRSYPTLSGNQTNQDFDAILVGDVSGNWTAPANGVAPDLQTAANTFAPAPPISISLPRALGVPGTTVTMPIKVSDLTNLDVLAYDFTLVFDPAVLQLQSVDTTDTLSRELQINTNTTTPGQVTVSAFGAYALARGGTLLNLKFKVMGVEGSATTLTWSDFTCNETALGAAAAKGSFAVEISGSAIGVHVNVSAASFRSGDLASEQIVSAFGVYLAARTEAATALPLPTELAGTRVEITDSLGIKRTAPLFYVSPQQINYQIPVDTAEGAATVMIWRDGQVISTGLIQITAIAPALFTVNTSGEGLPAAMILRVDASGAQSYEAIARFDTVTNRYMPIPINLGTEGDQVFLILYGTGIRGRSGLGAVNCVIDGVESETLYAGAAPGLTGADQVNLRLQQSLRGRGEVPLTVTINGRASNTVVVKIE